MDHDQAERVHAYVEEQRAILRALQLARERTPSLTPSYTFAKASIEAFCRLHAGEGGCRWPNGRRGIEHHCPMYRARYGDD